MTERRHAEPGSADWRLMECARGGDLEGVKQAIDEGASVQCYGDDGRLPIHHVAEGGNKETLQYLVDLGANINEKDKDGRLPIHHVAEGGNKEDLQYLVDLGANINEKDKNGWLPIHILARCGNKETLQYLVDSGANINEKDKAGRLPIHHAALDGNKETLQYLVESGANINEKDPDGWLPIHHAANSGNKETLQYLVDLGANVNEKDKYGRLPIHHAARRGNKETLQYLVDSGANINEKDPNGWLPIHIVSSFGSKEDLQYLVDLGANINEKDPYGRLPIHEVARRGKKETLQYLVDSGANINEKDPYGRLPIHHAARRGNKETLQYLVDSGANINEKDPYGRLPIHEVARRGNKETLQYLVDLGANINEKDKDGRLPIHHVARLGNKETLQYLVDSGANINEKDPDGRLPIHHVAEGGNKETLQYLVDLGANINEKDKVGLTPFQLALKSPFWEPSRQVVRALYAAGCVIDFRPEDLKEYAALEPESKAIVISKEEDCKEFLRSLEGITSSLDKTPFQPAVASPFALIICNQDVKDLVRILTLLPAEHLERLSVIGNTGGKVQFCELISKDLPNLKQLDVTYCDIESIPDECFSHVDGLELLNLSHNRLTKLSEAIETLTNLQHLNLNDNNLKSLTFDLSNFTHLECFSIGQNQIQRIPEIFPSCLKHLIFNDNKIKTLPISAIGALKKIEEVDFNNNPLTALMGTRLEDIQVYLREVGDALPNKVFKLHVLGDAEVGKSTMIRALEETSGTYTKKIDKTQGIDIRTLQLKDLECRVFDTGGDADFLETHLLFTSAGSLYVVVFNLAAFGYGESKLGRLHTWMEVINLHDPNARVILVGTHADDERLSPPVLQSVRCDVLKLLQRGHKYHQKRSAKGNNVNSCLLCKPEVLMEKLNLSKAPQEVHSGSSTSNNGESEREDLHLPHIVGYQEISSTKTSPPSWVPWRKNPSIGKLKATIEIEGRKVLVEDVPPKWSKLEEAIAKEIEESPQKVPLMTKVEFQEFTLRHNIPRDSVDAVVKFLENTGYIVHRRDGPDLVVLDPQWLSNQLCTLISFDKDFIKQGLLTQNELLKAWKEIPQKNHESIIKLLCEFGICFPVKDDEWLFPCKLPVGMPNRNTWPLEPEHGENQLTHIYQFEDLSFDFFSQYIVAVDRTKEDFHPGCTAFFSANHVVYFPKNRPRRQCPYHERFNSKESIRTGVHRVHTELLHYERRLAVTVRGRRPCCFMQEIDAMIRSTAKKNVSITISVACSKCLIRDGKLEPIYETKDCLDTMCANKHILGEWEDVLEGKLHDWKVSDQITHLEERMEDKVCPKFFLMLPVNRKALSLSNRIYSLLKDGWAVHLLCEYRRGSHLTNSPGLRLLKPKEFVKKHGQRAYQVLNAISKLGVPLSAAALVAPEVKVAQPVPRLAKQGAELVRELLDDFTKAFPDLTKDADEFDIYNPKQAEGLSRRQLAKLLNQRYDDNQDEFGGLYPTKFGGRFLWLCKKHHMECKEIS